MLESNYSHTENITPQKAKQWLDLNYDRQRPLSASKVAFYAGEMVKKRWHPTNPISFARKNGETILVNGQHTLAAVVKSGVTLKSNPVIYYQVEADDEIDNLYAHHDIGKGRSYSDSLRAYQVAENAGIPNSYVNYLSAAISYIKEGFPARYSRRDIAHEDLVELVFDWLPEFKAFLGAISPCDSDVRKKLITKPILAVALVTFRYQAEKAKLFWEQVAKINMLPRSDPRMALHRTLLTMTMATGENDGYSPAHLSRACAYAWNKWFGGVSLVLLKPNVLKVDRPISVHGTPYDGKTAAIDTVSEND